MSRYNLYYYLLFVLLIFGAFASMAQNDYGIKILGGAALAFGALFLLQLIAEWRAKGAPGTVVMVELLGLVVLAVILFMRVFYLRFPYVELAFGLAGLMVIGSYGVRIVRTWNTLRLKSRALAVLAVAFLVSVTCYFVSMTLVPFIPVAGEVFGAAGFLFLVVFIAGGLLMQQLLVQGERITVFAYVARVRDRSIVLASLFVLFTAYMGLTKTGIIPKIYSNEFPQKYFELVDRAESGEEKPVDGKFRHEEFKRQYDRFIQRHRTQEK